MNKKKVAFVCVHNSCRSQIAEALGKHLAGDVLECYSAGTETKPQINQDAVRLMKKLYNIDREKTQYSKTYDKIPTPDIAISMGCDVGCPYIGRDFDDNWGLPDSTGGSDEAFMEASDEEFDTEEVRKLVKRLDELDPIPLPWKSDEEALKDFWDYCEERQREERIIAEMKIKG